MADAATFRSDDGANFGVEHADVEAQSQTDGDDRHERRERLCLAPYPTSVTFTPSRRPDVR